MKNITKYILYIPVMLLLVMTSCFEDKGNYDYGEINDAAVNIPGVTDNKDAVSRDRYTDLVLAPEIQFHGGAAAGDFSFEWSLYPQKVSANPDGDYPPKKIIGNTQNLNYNLVDAPTKYFVVLRIVHGETKATTDYRFELEINSVKGWIVYDENATGEGDFQIVRDGEIVPGLAAVQNGVVRNYFSTSNGGLKLQDGKFLGRRTINTYDHLFLFKADGVYKMSAQTFEVVTENYADLFLSTPKVSAPQAHYYPSPAFGALELLLNNNEMHVIKWSTMGQTDLFPSALNIFGTPNKVDPFVAPIPVVASNTNRYALYDGFDANGRFVTINSSGNVINPATSTGAFNTAKLNEDAAKKFQLTYLGQGRDGITCAVLKNTVDADKPWLYVADLRKTATPLALAKHDLSGLTEINDAKLFMFGTRGDVMFYATPSGVYSYVFGGSVTNILPLSGEEIVSMKLYTHSANEDYSGRMLFVATYDGAQGKVYKIKFNELNGQVEGDIDNFSGFGKIIDMINKE